MKVVEIPFGAVGLDFLEPPPSFVVAQEIDCDYTVRVLT